MVSMSKTSANFQSIAGILLVILACTFWAFDTLIRYPLIGSGVGAISIVFYEHLILTVIFLVVFFKSFSKIFSAKKRHFFYFFMLGGVGSALATVAFTRAFQFLNPSLVILLQKFQPIVAILLARWVLDEKINRLFILWASICLLGGLLVSYEDILNILNSDQNFKQLFLHDQSLLGYFLVMISVFGWGSATVFGKKLGKEGYSDEQIMAGRFIMGFLCLLPIALNLDDIFTHSINVYGKISLMVLVSGLLAMWVFYQGLRRTSARACSLAEMFFPFMAVIVNWLFLGATLTPIQIMGGGLLLLGSIVIQLKQY
jgi:drug/metabolite transporter (DMT)-like permease